MEHYFKPHKQVALRGRQPHYYIGNDIILPINTGDESGAIGESKLRWNRKLFQPSKEHLAKMLAEVSKGEDQVIDWGNHDLTNG